MATPIGRRSLLRHMGEHRSLGCSWLGDILPQFRKVIVLPPGYISNFEELVALLVQERLAIAMPEVQKLMKDFIAQEANKARQSTQ
jgi:hypothetical protein